MEWRFFWPHAEDDMVGANVRLTEPTPEEIGEWKGDLLRFCVQRRVVQVGPWETIMEHSDV